MINDADIAQARRIEGAIHRAGLSLIKVTPTEYNVGLSPAVALVCSLKADPFSSQSVLYNIRLAEEKLDQHLQGQYNQPPYRALGTALAALRAVLLELESTKEKV